MQILNYQNVLILGSTQESISFVCADRSSIMNICLVNPTGEFMVVMRKGKILDLYRITTAEIVSVIIIV